MTKRQAIATVIMVAIILAGMIGLYYGLYQAWQIYQQKSAQLSTPKGILSLLGLVKTPAPAPPAIG